MHVEKLIGLKVYPRSVVQVDSATYFLVRGHDGGSKYLGILGKSAGFEGTREMTSGALLCPLTAANASALRIHLAWLRPQPLGLQTSVGFGDRLGLATPGHVRAVRGTDIAPMFAQQSVRENARTGRTPQQVIDDAMWGLFQEGWRGPWGADADHLKTLGDIGTFLRAGYTSYTVDPGDHVDNAAHMAPFDSLHERLHTLPWAELQDSPDRLYARYMDRCFSVEEFTLQFDEIGLLRAVCKYTHAILHTVRMWRYLRMAMGNRCFELEVSVDETEAPTSPVEHFFIARELRRLGVEWVSIAPRYVGRFEKGVDYIGDLSDFEANFGQHAAIARVLGPYKLSLHSGSDKFSIYPIAVRLAGNLVHLKTSGTSYLEALRVIAQVDAPFFREILALARACYEMDHLGYQVSAQLAKVPAPASLADAELPDLLEQFHSRQVLHVTFGSVLDRFGEELHAVLNAHEEVYHTGLAEHVGNHLARFKQRDQQGDE